MTLPNGCKVWLALGAELLAPVSNWTWTDVTDYVLYDQGGGVTVEIGYPDGSDEANPTTISFLADNADGRWSPYNPAGAWFGQIDFFTPVKVTFDPGSGAVDRGLAYLSDLPLEWTPGGKFKYVRVEALGILSRLESGDVLESSARRWLSYFYAPVAYWPCEDGSDATRMASAVAGQLDGTGFHNMQFAADSDFGGSKPLLKFAGSDSYVTFPVLAYSRPAPEAWTVVRAWRVPSRPAGTVEFGPSVFCHGTVRRFVLEMTSATPSIIRLRGYDASGVELLADSGLAFDNVGTEATEPFGEQLAVSVSAVQNGTGIDWSYEIWRTNQSGSGGLGTVASQTLGPVYALTTGGVGDLTGHTVGHFAVYASATASGTASSVANGGLGERTIDRFLSQGALAGVPINSDVAGVGEPMGYAPTGTALDILRECDALDRGLMWETPGGDLKMRSLSGLTNQSVGMTLAYATQVRDLQPTSVIRSLVNRSTVSRDGGSSATVDATGPLSPAIKGIVRAKSATVNSQLDDNLKYYAQWEVGLGTCQDYRYTVEVQFHGGASSKLADWLALEIGDRVQITSPPSWLPPDTIDGLLRGYTEHFTRFEYTATFRLLPYRPYLAWTVEGSGNLGKVNTSGSKLLAPITTSATSAIVGTYGNPKGRTGVAAKWSTTSLPYDLAIRTAERVTCTAVTNNAPTFVAAGTAAHADNAAVTPGAVAGIAAGDCELLLCSIRDSGGFANLGGVAGRVAIYVGDQTGWTELVKFGGANGSFALYARTYQTGVLTPPPTLTPVAGSSSAGDTVSAQLAAFRYAQPLAHSTALVQSNASAADIAYPGLTVVRDGTVVLIVAQKDDDWTSVASPAGFTEIGEPDSTLGSDQGLAWYYQIQTTATNIAAGSLVVTGGAAATSKAQTVSLLGDVQTLTLTRNVNAVSGGVAHPVGADIEIWRGGVMRRP